MSYAAVMPLVTYSMIASMVNQYTDSPVSLASAGNTRVLSHSSSFMSSAWERRKVIAECVCASLNPGITRFPPASISLSHFTFPSFIMDPA